MELIPVIDLMGGQVVHAVRGERAKYQPLRSALCTGSAPCTVAAALARRSGSAVLYVADLDALQGRPRQQQALTELLHADPARRCWVDAGFTSAEDAIDWRAGFDPPTADRLVPVLASESLLSLEGLHALAALDEGRGAVLSLDRRHGQVMDRAGCWQQPERWPQRVIVMTLERVGSGEGPDLDTLRQVRASAPRAALIGAGGVRHATDLVRAREAGAQAWLVATAWHQGTLGDETAVRAPQRPGFP